MQLTSSIRLQLFEQLPKLDKQILSKLSNNADETKKNCEGNIKEIIVQNRKIKR